MKQEYKIAKGWAIFIWITLPIFMVLFGWLGIMPFVQDEFDLIMAIEFTSFSVGLEFLMILGLVDITKSKWIIENNTITAIRVFKTRHFKLEEIKGFKHDQNYLHFIPKDTSAKNIKVSPYVGQFGHLITWCENNLINLDREEIINEEKDILENEEYGRNIHEREYRFIQAKRLTKGLNIVSVIVGALTLFYPHYYKIQIIVCSLLPIIGLVVLNAFKGLIKIDGKPNTTHPKIFLTFLIPSCALAMRALVDFTIFDYENFWIPAIFLFTVYGFIILKETKRQFNLSKGLTYLSIFGMLAFGALYIYGMVITTNVTFDNAQPQMYKAQILNKRISSGDSETHYLKLGEWGPQSEIKDVSVSKDIYENKVIGDSAIIYYNNGLFKIPYYIVIQ